MAEDRTCEPGEKTPARGIHQCDRGQRRSRGSTEVRGHALPPLPPDCPGTGWKLSTPAHPE